MSRTTNHKLCFQQNTDVVPKSFNAHEENMRETKGDKFTYISTELQEHLAQLYMKSEDTKIKKGTGTRELLKIIPEKELAFLIGCYKNPSSNWDEDDDPSKTFPRSFLEHRIYLPKSEMKKIRRVLESLKKEDSKWLTDDSMEKILTYIKIQMSFSRKGRKYICSELIRKNLKTGGRYLKNPALNILIMQLVELLKSETGKPQYNLIGDFLSEQGIFFAEEEDTIRKLYEKGIQSFEKLSAIIRRDSLILNVMVRLNFKLSPEDLKYWTYMALCCFREI